MKGMKASFCFIVIIAQAVAASSFSPSPAIQNKQKQFSAKSIPNLPPAKKSTLNLSAAMLVRGGADVALKSFYGDALGFFGGIRIPATFLAGSSLAAIFTLKGAANSLSSDGGMTQLEKRVVKFYHFVSLIGFLLSLNTIVMATSAHTSVLHGRFDAMAETAYLMIKREFEYEFVMVRWSFLTSLFCFLGMVTSRILIEFGLLKEDHDKGTKKDVAALVVFSIGALASNLMSFVNQKLWCWNSLVGMGFHLAKLVWQRALDGGHPLQMLSVFCTIISMYLMGKLAVRDIKDDRKKKS